MICSYSVLTIPFLKIVVAIPLSRRNETRQDPLVVINYESQSKGGIQVTRKVTSLRKFFPLLSLPLSPQPTPTLFNLIRVSFNRSQDHRWGLHLLLCSAGRTDSLFIRSLWVALSSLTRPLLRNTLHNSIHTSATLCFSSTPLESLSPILLHSAQSSRKWKRPTQCLKFLLTTSTNLHLSINPRKGGANLGSGSMNLDISTNHLSRNWK